MDRKLLNKLKFHLARVVQDGNAEDWAKVGEVVQALEGQVATASSAALAKLLAREGAALREGRLPSDYARLLRELDSATRKDLPEDEELAGAEEQVAALLRGRAIVVIGGDPRPEHQERLRQTFKLTQVYWPSTKENRPDVAALEPFIARPDVAVVVLLIRWIRHALNEVAGVCERHEKPMARVTGGYNPSAVAAAVLEQCGKRLGG